jgi:hypothetical protein
VSKSNTSTPHVQRDNLHIELMSAVSSTYATRSFVYAVEPSLLNGTTHTHEEHSKYVLMLSACIILCKTQTDFVAIPPCTSLTMTRRRSFNPSMPYLNYSPLPAVPTQPYAVNYFLLMLRATSPRLITGRSGR